VSRVRLAWSALPDHVRGEIEDRLGAAVVDVHSHEGGYSPGMAATLTSATGERAFVKAVSTSFHQRSSELYRDEARVNALLPAAAPAPRMLWSFDDGEWVAIAFEAADGGVELPWDERTIEEVLAVYDVLAGIEGPAGLPTVPHALGAMTGWHTALVDGSDLGSWDPWVGHNLRDLERLSRDYGSRAAGTALVHLDARRDNMVRRGGRVLLVDWPYAAVGAPWVDLLAQLPSITLEGGGDPADLWARAGVSKDVAEDDVTTVLAGIAGFFVHGSVQSPPPGIPHVRAFQRAQGEIALTWLRQRLGE
jgi:aminoglycoside phosphotransferase (APT) family kinase protein